MGEYDRLLEFIRQRIGTVANLKRCLGHGQQSLTYRVLKKLAQYRGSMEMLNKIAHCIGVPAWYLLMQMSADSMDAAFAREEKELLADLERIKAHNPKAAWAYYIELVKRGKDTPAIRAWADRQG